MTSFATLPSETLVKIRKHLSVAQLVHVGQACRRLHALFASVAWANIGYFPKNYTMQGTHFAISDSKTFKQCSPVIPNNVLSGHDAIEMDTLTFLLMNNLVSDRTLSYIKTVTICAGYGIGRVTVTSDDEDGKDPATSLHKNAGALFDTAILEIYAHYPTVYEPTLEIYTQLFADTGLLGTWLTTLMQATLSIHDTKMFTSAFLRGRRLKVGPRQSRQYCSCGEKSSNFGYAKALATNEFSFAEFIATQLLQFPNMDILALDAHCSFGLEDLDNGRTRALYSLRAECLLSSISRILAKLPNVEARLSLHGRLLHNSFLSKNTGDFRQVKVARFECYNTSSHYLRGIRFMKTLQTRSGVKKLEIVTTNDPSRGDPLHPLDQTTVALVGIFLNEVADLPIRGTATDIALCSQFLTSYFYSIPLLNESYTVAQYTVTLAYVSELENIRAMFRHAGAPLTHLKIISAARYQLDVPGTTQAGLVSLTDIVLCNISLSPRTTKCMLKPGTRITQVVA